MTPIQNTTLASANKVDDIDLGKILGIVIDSRWSIIIIIMIATIIGIGKALLSTPIYQAEALIQVEQKSNGLSGMLGINDGLSAESSTSAEIELIKSRMILGETVDRLDLTTVVSPQYPAIIGSSLARLSGKEAQLTVQRFDSTSNTPLVLEIQNLQQQTFKIFNGQEQQVAEGVVGELVKNSAFELMINKMHGEKNQRFTIVKQSRNVAINKLRNSLTIFEKGKSTGMLALTMTGVNPELIKTILNDISTNYVLKNIERKSEEAENGIKFASTQIIKIKNKLTQAEDKLNNYRLKHGSIDLNLEANAALTSLIAVEAQLGELKFKEAELAKRFTKDHPSYIGLLDKRNFVLNQKRHFEKQIKLLPQTQQDVLRLTRDVNVNQQIYMQLLNKAQELQLVKAGTVGNVRIVDDAYVNSTPIAPKKKLIVVLALFIGVIIGLAQAFIRAVFHQGIENPDQIEQIGLPVYASIPMSDWQLNLDKKRKNQQSPTVKQTLLAVSNPADLSIEALRSLRTSLHFAMMEAKNNVLMITGPSPEIGKSFVSANMAAVLAKTGQRVLVIDADMRKGRMERQFCVSSKDGLSDYLSGQKNITDIIKQSGIDNLDFISRGDTPPNPSELLMHPRFSELMAWVSANYDIVVIDTPPILAVTDAAVVGAHAGTTLMVGRFEKSVVKEVEISKQRFEQNGIEVKGFILNAVVRKASGYYGNYGYYQYSYVSDKK
ncbi:polysaccharide biosynthesis tyrosine autokinase [Photobacterium phosphoreum]|uniref:polysaccharide biosynthesis tyrosine autokinase n=1 Tax=Photobacterium phosphoreum TaxID=659 RepID=UPI000D15EB5D|nr:polysaccharide biosynthesis tyrosine autokinase [Photobacterium phosphoreum]PSU57809.1 tyrosine-protein kinase [Photobacterium phosphoreum]